MFSRWCCFREDSVFKMVVLSRGCCLREDVVCKVLLSAIGCFLQDGVFRHRILSVIGCCLQADAAEKGMVMSDAIGEEYFHPVIRRSSGIFRLAHIEDTERLTALRYSGWVLLVFASHLPGKAGPAPAAALSALLSEDDGGGGCEALCSLCWAVGASGLGSHVFFVPFFGCAVVGSPYLEQRPVPRETA